MHYRPIQFRSERERWPMDMPTVKDRSPNSTWLVTSRLVTTRHVRRAERVETSVSSRAVPAWRTTNKL